MVPADWSQHYSTVKKSQIKQFFFRFCKENGKWVQKCIESCTNMLENTVWKTDFAKLQVSIFGTSLENLRQLSCHSCKKCSGTILQASSRTFNSALFLKCQMTKTVALRPFILSGKDPTIIKKTERFRTLLPFVPFSVRIIPHCFSNVYPGVLLLLWQWSYSRSRMVLLAIRWFPDVTWWFKIWPSTFLSS